MNNTNFSGALFFGATLDSLILSKANLEGAVICQISEEGDDSCLEWLQRIDPKRDEVLGPIGDNWEIVEELVEGHPFVTDEEGIKHYVIRSIKD